MTPTDIKRRVLSSFGDRDAVFILESDIIDWINSGQLDIVKETGCITGTDSSNDANDFPVNFPTGWLRTLRVLYGDIALQPVGIEELDNKRIPVELTETQPLYFYERNRQICLFPTPETSDTTDITVDYIKAPTVINNISGDLTIPESYHDQLVTYVLAEAHKRNNNLRTYQQMRSEYEHDLIQTAEMENMKDDTYPVIADDPWEDNYGYI